MRVVIAAGEIMEYLYENGGVDLLYMDGDKTLYSEWHSTYEEAEAAAKRRTPGLQWDREPDLDYSEVMAVSRPILKTST